MAYRMPEHFRNIGSMSHTLFWFPPRTSDPIRISHGLGSGLRRPFPPRKRTFDDETPAKSGVQHVPSNTSVGSEFAVPVTKKRTIEFGLSNGIPMSCPGHAPKRFRSVRRRRRRKRARKTFRSQIVWKRANKESCCYIR